MTHFLNILRRTTSGVACLSLALATSALAQPEQWLQYHVGVDESSYRRLDVTTNAPDGVALPALAGRAYFAFWQSPLDPAGGRWMCFDRTRKTGPHDRLYFDSNGNGRLDDEQVIESASRDRYRAWFSPVRVVFQTEDGPVAYHIAFQFRKYSDESIYLYAQSGGWYEGMVDFAGTKRRVRLFDDNVNGTFNDLATGAGTPDRIVLVGEKGGGDNQRYLGRLLELDGRWFKIEVAQDGAFIKVQEATNIAFGEVHLPADVSEFVALGLNSQFTRKPVEGKFTLPAGHYKVHGWTVIRKDEKGGKWQLIGDRFPPTATFDVTPDKPVSLPIGDPIHAQLTATESGSEVSFDLRYRGQLNEALYLYRGNDTPRAPRLTLTSRDGSFTWSNNFTYG